VNQRPNGLHVDAHGIVAAGAGEYGSEDDIAVIAQDGTGFAQLVTAPAGTISSVTADDDAVYYVTGKRALMRVPRGGGSPSVVVTAEGCAITAVSAEAGRLHVATSTDGASTRSVWRVGN
jgi:hypothetical protein